RKIAGRAWRRATDRERILNKATFVFDLSRDDDALIAAMSPHCRRKLRKAREAGLRVEIEDRPSSQSFERLMEKFERMAKEKDLRSPGRGTVRRMCDSGDLTLFQTLEGEEMLAAATAYRAGDKAIFLIGVSADKRNDGAGQLLHFEILRALRPRGVRWYDFGG